LLHSTYQTKDFDGQVKFHSFAEVLNALFMIQRWQTLFLILALVANGLMFNFDFWSAEATNDSDQVVEELQMNIMQLNYHPNEEGDAQSETNIWILALYGLASILALVAIFLYSNRKIQLRISRFAMLVETTLLVLVFLYTDDLAQQYFQHPVSDTNYQTGIFLPIISVVCFFVANMFIMRDQRLVRSADRLR
jgi:hypothetical protein